MKILVVEDCPQVTRFLEELFRDTPIQISSASTLDDAINMIEFLAPDLILADVNLPDGNALEVVPILKTEQETRNIPIIAMSGMSPEKLKKIAVAAGCDDWLSKPFKVEEVETRVFSRLGLEESN